MRLQETIKNKIIQLAQQHFGKNMHLYLFGSRVYDEKKGGDIDLFLETDAPVSMQTQINFLRDVYKNATQRKIDLLIKTPDSKDRSIFHSAKDEGILLC